MTEIIIAELAYTTARQLLSESTKKQGGAEPEPPALRLKNLLKGEVEGFLRYWTDHAESDNLSPVTVVVAHDAEIACDQRFFADADKSITWYRNNNAHGLIYVQTKVESDEQGLESMFTIQDRNYLDGSIRTESFDPARRIVEIAWQEAGAKPGSMPERLAELLLQVRNDLQSRDVSVSVRNFAAFALAAAQALHPGSDDAIDDTELRASIGLSLARLGLFPDELWDTDSNSGRRLHTNHRLADLMDPSGVVDQEPTELRLKIDATDFVDQHGAQLDAQSQANWRAACCAFVESRTESSRRAVPFSIYRQVFSGARTAGTPLGDRVREEVAHRDALQLGGFDDLDVQEGLNARDAESARKLIEEPARSSSEVPLIDLLSPATQKLLNKLAYPRDRLFANPFIEIVEILRSFDTNDLQGATLEIRCGLAAAEAAKNPSIGLFAFLYGPTLAEIVEQSQIDSTGVSLSVDAALLDVKPAPAVGSGVSDDDEEDTPVPVEWDGVPVEIRLRRSQDDGAALLEETTNLRWRPEDIQWIAFGWLMIAADDAVSPSQLWELPSDDFDALAQEMAARLLPLPGLVKILDGGTATANPVVSTVVDLRRDFLQAVAQDGLDASRVDEYVEEWTRQLSIARKEFVPTGVTDPHLSVVLSLDTVHSIEESRAVMLFSHPLRIRWLAAYLREQSALCLSALDRTLQLNSVNEERYFRALQQLSPHGQPPLLSNRSRTLLIPVAEKGFSEIYSAIKREGQVTSRWRSELDNAALGEIVHEIRNYLRAHPHKRDGISLVFVLPAGGSVPFQIVDLVRKDTEMRDLQVQCHVFAPRNTWDGLVESFQVLDTSSRIMGSERLSPPLQLELFDWLGELKTAEALADTRFDIAIVPNFFGNKVDVNEYADPPRERPGSFHPLYDDSTYVDREMAAGSVSIVLRPEGADPVLDDWSTTNVRLFRSEAISPQTPDSIDYVKLRVRFEEAGELFAALHDCCHWVITLDRYIGRDQIESLPKRPDVLTVRENVGPSGLFTLLVSSNAGKEFVIQRLGRKLQRISGVIPGLDSHALALRVYDEIREVAPGLILRSMGVSRITEEVLGLMVAKRIAEQHRPPSGAAVWISLDEHSDWFGGDNAVRADLCRIELTRQDGRLHIGVLVVEGKLRKQYDAHGKQQVTRTLQLIRDALLTGDEETPAPKDAVFWRHQLLAGIRGAVGRGTGDEPADHAEIIDEVMREDFRAGDFDIAYTEGLYSICIYDRPGLLTCDSSDGVFTYQSSSSEVLGLIGDGEPIAPVDASVSQDPPAEDSHPTTQGADALQHDGQPTINKTHGNDDVAEIDAAPPVNVSGELDQPSRMSQQSLVGMYQKILDTFASFDVKVHSPKDGKPPFVEGPAFVQFRVKPGTGVDPKRINERDGALRLALGLDEGKLLRFAIGGGTVNIDVPKADTDRYYVRADQLWQRWSGRPDHALAVPLGINQRDEVVDIEFSSANSPHMLIGGTTGSGKSEALNTILHGLTRFYGPDELRLVLIDPKQTELLAFENQPHLLGEIGSFDDEAIESLDSAVAEMQKRYCAFKTKKARSLAEYNQAVSPDERLPWHVVVLDEYADLVSEADARRKIEGYVKRLSAKARACGIHLIVATQKPSAENISTTVRSNLPAQLALRCRGATESRVIIDENGAESLNGKGDAFLKIADRLERIQCAIV